MIECIRFDMPQALRKNNCRKISAARKCNTLNYLLRVGQCDLFQAPASFESALSNFFHACGKVDFPEMHAVCKCIFSDFLQSIRQNCRRKIFAAQKCFALDFPQRIGQRGPLQALTAGKRTVPDLSHSRGKGEFAQMHAL